MQPRPQPDPSDPWQLLRLRAKILYDDVVRARQARGPGARASARRLRALGDFRRPRGVSP